MCVFCYKMFSVGQAGGCCVQHDVEDWGDGEYERQFAGHSEYGGTFTQHCTRCWEKQSADGPEDEGPRNPDLDVCYEGQHSSDPYALKAFRVRLHGQEEHNSIWGADDKEYKSQ
mmetsp:Transcript_33177/g.60105  ORF Transcript_33177/g.60105 Transcript_33177/m.60105 type:complete len:114 (-) Transcript_33177:182-523(-)